ncbi:hypothetical protein JL722_2770 [Aureococcus anophagefferens]|nr:hypothetical protein JL722_2770 [Aureococcus anophagefferens]
MQKAEDRARDARRAAAGVEPVSAVHRAREDAVHGMRSARDREAQERAAAAARSVFVGLCEASPERPDLRCDADDRKWLDGKLAVAGSAYLADAAPFAHRAAVAAEELAEAEASFDAVDRRFERLPRLDRKETFGLRGLVAPFDCRKGLAEAASKLNKALLLDKDGGRVADDFVRTATSKATTYFSTYGAVDWNHKDILENPSKRNAAVARALATDPEARALASLDAAVASSTRRSREAALEADAAPSLTRPSEKLLIAARDAENRLAHLAGEAKKAGFALQDALAAAAAANALGPPPSREDADALRDAYRRSLAAHGAAAGALEAAEAAVGADVAADAHDAVAALAFALDRRRRRPSPLAHPRASSRRSSRRPRSPRPARRTCATARRRPPRARARGSPRARRRPEPRGPNAPRRWVAALPCGFEVGPRAAWFGAAADAALGLAVLRGEAHVVAGPAPRGALRFWPGSPPDFAPADGAWLLRRDGGA